MAPLVASAANVSSVHKCVITSQNAYHSCNDWPTRSRPNDRSKTNELACWSACRERSACGCVCGPRRFAANHGSAAVLLTGATGLEPAAFGLQMDAKGSRRRSRCSASTSLDRSSGPSPRRTRSSRCSRLSDASNATSNSGDPGTSPRAGAAERDTAEAPAEAGTSRRHRGWFSWSSRAFPASACRSSRASRRRTRAAPWRRTPTDFAGRC